jgi:HK97 family phage prohead protease
VDGLLLRRAFSETLHVRTDSTGDGLTVEGRVVPYGEVVIHQDEPGGPIYRERFVYGALSGMVAYLHRVKLGMEHESGYVSNVGRAVKLEDKADGAYVTFRLYRQDAEKALDHLDPTHGTHRGLSLEFYAIDRPYRASDGVLERRRVKVHRVAAVQDPAYKRAEVVSIREAAKLAQGAPEDQEAPDAPQEAPQPAERTRLDEALAIRAQLQRDAPTIAGRPA